MKSPDKIVVIDRFPPLRHHLLTLLAGLGEEDWALPTVAPRWSVKDVALHLLGGDVGILSRERDAVRAPVSTAMRYSDLVDLITRLNEEWIVAARRMSPRLLCELLAFTGVEVEKYFSSLDPEAIGGPVSWAGPDPAPVWFDIAREFTERWHHQQQVRDATGRPPLYDPYFFSPVLETFVRALPYSFRNTPAPLETVVRFEISGHAGNAWFLHRTLQGWKLALESRLEPATDVVLPQDAAWRLFTKGMNRKQARALAVIRGQEGLAAPIFDTTSIIG